MALAQQIINQSLIMLKKKQIAITTYQQKIEGNIINITITHHKLFLHV